MCLCVTHRNLYLNTYVYHFNTTIITRELWFVNRLFYENFAKLSRYCPMLSWCSWNIIASDSSNTASLVPLKYTWYGPQRYFSSCSNCLGVHIPPNSNLYICIFSLLHISQPAWLKCRLFLFNGFFQIIGLSWWSEFTPWGKPSTFNSTRVICSWVNFLGVYCFTFLQQYYWKTISIKHFI